MDKISNNKININAINGANKVYNEDMTFSEQVAKIIKDVTARAEREVAEYGDFAPVSEYMPNLDKDTTAVGKYGLRVYKMNKDIVPDPKQRYIEAAAYAPAGDYKADMVVGMGHKEDIMNQLKSPQFPEKLNNAYAELLNLLEQE